MNIENDLDSLSPNIRSRFLKIGYKEITTASDETVMSSPSDKVSDSGHGSTVDTDEEADQNEPLDLSLNIKKPPNDDLFDKSELKYSLLI